MDKSSFISFEDTSLAFADKTNAELYKIFLLFKAINYPRFTNIGTFAVNFMLAKHFPIKFLIKPTLYRQFCGGEDVTECLQTVNKLAEAKLFAILDYSIEGEKNDVNFDKTMGEILKTISLSASNSTIPFCVFKMSGLVSTKLLQKIQQKEALYPWEEKAYQTLLKRLDTIASFAAEKHVRLMADAEETWIQDVIDQLVLDLMRKFNKTEPLVYNTAQMYRKDRPAYLTNLFKTAATESFHVGIKLVRGAYMEKERAYATEHKLPDPIQANKAATDKAYNDAMELCLQTDHVAICAGTHNENSCQLLVKHLQHTETINSPDHFFAQLYGMSDNISYNLAAAGFNVAKYVPYGPVEKVMPYLFRRAQENTSVAGQSGRELELIVKEIKRRRA